jgi:hypothetical protein
MPTRRTRKAGNERGHSCLAEEPRAGNQPPGNLLPAEDLAFFAAWRSGSVPCPGAFLRVRQLQRANPGFFVVLHGGAQVDKPARSFRGQSHPKTQPEVRNDEDHTARGNGHPEYVQHKPSHRK